MLSTEEIRKSMRITHTHLDEEIKRNINTALRDLRRVGMNTEDNDLIDKACELYVKAQLDYQGKGDQFQKNYEALRDAISLSGVFREESGRYHV